MDPRLRASLNHGDDSLAGIIDTITSDLTKFVQTAYQDVAPIAATGASLFHYAIPGDSDIKRLQSESKNLSDYSNQLKSLMNQLLKSGDSSVKAQQDDLRSQAATIISNAQTAIKELNNAAAAIQKIQANTASGQSVSVGDTSQIAALTGQAEALYNASLSDIGSAISQIKMFFNQNVVAPSQVGVKQVAQTVGGIANTAVTGAGSFLQQTGNATIAAAQNAPGAILNTGTLLKYLPWLVGGAVVIGGALYLANLPKPKSGFSFGS